MYIRLVDKQNFKSPILYIHSDEDEWLEQINIWRRDLLAWVETHPLLSGMPLARLEADMCIVDLIRHLSQYYVDYNDALSKISPDSIFTQYEGRVVSTLRLVSSQGTEVLKDEEILEIKTYCE